MVNTVAVVAWMLILFPPAAAGQNTVTIFSEETQGYERIGTALIECTYRYAWLQDTTSGTRMTPEGTLLSGDSTDIADDVMLLVLQLQPVLPRFADNLAGAVRN